VIKFKVCKQLDAYCGPATLKIVFDYLGLVKSQEEWAKLAGATHEEGMQNDGLFKAIKAVGYSYKFFKVSSFEDIKKFLDKKIPVIVVWWTGQWGHYSVVADISQKTIILADPSIGQFKRINLKRFDHLWFDFAQDYERKPEDLELRTFIAVLPKK